MKPIVILIIIFVSLFFGSNTTMNKLEKPVYYHNQKYGFTFEIPDGAQVLEPNRGNLVNEIRIGSQSDVATISAYPSESVDEWLSNHISFAIDAQGNPMPNYQHQKLNGNAAAILYINANCIGEALIYHNKNVFLIKNFSGEPASCPILEKITQSFIFDKL
jgi:hypothetical protein